MEDSNLMDLSHRINERLKKLGDKFIDIKFTSTSYVNHTDDSNTIYSVLIIYDENENDNTNPWNSKEDVTE